MTKKLSYRQQVNNYVNSVLTGKKLVSAEVKKACERFKKDLENEKFEFHNKEPDLVISIIEKIMVHKQGEALDGTPLMNTPFLL